MFAEEQCALTQQHFESIQSLDSINIKEQIAAEKFCKQEQLNPKDFIWTTKDYSDGIEETVDIAYNLANPFQPAPEYTANMSVNGKEIIIAPVLSEVWDTNEDTT